jgi:hypothetical protein
LLPANAGRLIDYTAAGSPELGSTVFFPMITTSWQKQFGNVDATPSNIYEDKYASGIDTLLSSYLSSDDLYSSGKLPRYAFFPANATPGPVNTSEAINYGADNLVRESYLTTWFNDVQAKPLAWTCTTSMRRWTPCCSTSGKPTSKAGLRTRKPTNCAIIALSRPTTR